MAGSWKALTNQPTFAASTMLLLTDGTVMCQESGGVNWWKLTPNNKGSYVKGTWSPLAPMNHTRLYYGSAVLADGRVIVTGGEYSNAGSETNDCEIYDPIADSWTDITPPAGWGNLGDGSSSLLPDGTFLTGNAFDARTAIYDPVAGAWSAGPTMLGRSSEESWVLLPDETVLAPQCVNHPGSEKLVLAASTWVTAGTIPADLVENASSEIGPGVLLPDGRAFFVGATGRTALYTPPAIANQPGTWAAGPTFPTDAGGQQLGAKDAPGCLLPNGNVLCAVGPVDGQANSFLPPTSFFEFDGTSLIRVADPPNAASVPFVGRMLLLPTGEVLFAAGSAAMYAYVPSGGPDFVWRPTITACPHWLRQWSSYTLHGRQLNGLSQAVGYGDDAMAATNYPLVRIRHLATGRVYYCRTTDQDTMGVATGTAVHSTNFKVPFGAPVGASELCVIANGIESPCRAVRVLPFFRRFPFDEAMFNWLIGSLADGPLWVLGPHGPIPVDPWGPFARRKAAQARKQLIDSLKQLRALGDQVARNRERMAGRIAREVDKRLLGALDRRGRGAKKKSGSRPGGRRRGAAATRAKRSKRQRPRRT
jgi:Kelch motif